MKQITAFIHGQGAVAGIQLAHAGRKASHTSPWNGGKQVKEVDGGWLTVAPSAIAFYYTEETPAELGNAGIQKVIDNFKQATKRAVAAGFRVVEIHAAHGYLIHQFLSPLSNKRTDEYGGGFENRIRILPQITDAVQSEWPVEFPLFVRISASDCTEGGWSIDDSVKLSIILKEKGVDLIDCSSGGIIPGVK